MRCAVLENNVVVRVQEWDAPLPQGVVVTATGNIGDSYDNGIFVPPPTPDLTPEEVYAVGKVTVQVTMDKHAQEWGYENLADGLSYINSTNATWKAEAEALNVWRDENRAWLETQKPQATPVVLGGSTKGEVTTQAVAIMPAAPTRPV
jgi:hypothetical protein